ncbi:MAG: potassium transporter Kup [Chthoniobacterales bacterium]
MASGKRKKSSAPAAEKPVASVPAKPSASGAAAREEEGKRRLPLLCLTTLGVVYGDIGTSPLYALRECFRDPSAQGHLAVNPPNVLGVLSLITWSLLIVISVKYLLYVMRADNKGEGGILALLALMQRAGRSRKAPYWFLALSVFGAALLYGDGMITPAISVLSAVEGLKIATAGLKDFVVPITIAILCALFFFQRSGTKRVGLIFGPVMLVWFLTIGLLGAVMIVRQPSVLAALNPLHGLHFFARNGWIGFTVLGAVFLVVTGGEALYADLGHFGRRPIRVAWFGLVLPALLLNYFGQGALVLQSAKEIEHPFFHLAPSWALYPLVFLATLAAVIASQAVISGVFSLTRQAVLLDHFPRVGIYQTSDEALGQIYVPSLNWLLMIACVGLVLGFRSSSNLAAAYGVAVTTTMVITTILLAAIARRVWKWNGFLVLGLSAAFLVIDLGFFGANILKFIDGGWFPLLIGALVFLVMTTWHRGRELIWDRLRKTEKSLDKFLGELHRDPPVRVEGTSIFLTGRARGTPAVLVHHLQHNKALSERAIVLNVETQDLPHIPPRERVEAEELREGFRRITLNFGYMDEPNVPKALELMAERDAFDLEEVTYYVGRQTPVPARRSRITLWRETLFAFLNRNTAHPVHFFHIPPAQVVELGIEVEI